jgi:SAM-dependent methyltransferase
MRGASSARSIVRYRRRPVFSGTGAAPIEPPTAEPVLDAQGIWVLPARGEVAYPPRGNDDSFRIEESSFWFSHRNDVIAAIVERFPFPGDFADVGGGNGLQTRFLSERLPAKRFVLIEPGYAGCLNAKGRGARDVFNMRFEDFPFRKFRIGGVGLFDVLEHVEDDAAFLSGLARKLAPGSRLYVTVPAHRWLWSDVDDYGRHFRRYDGGRLAELAAPCGLELAYEACFFSYLVAPLFLLRSLPYRLRGPRGADEIMRAENAHHRSGGIAASLLNALHAAELGLLRGRGPWFGASRAAVYAVK